MFLILLAVTMVLSIILQQSCLVHTMNVETYHIANVIPPRVLMHID